jgi:hypothetical protein
MNYSLNQVKSILEKFASDHLQVNEFYLKDPLELLNNAETKFCAMVALFMPSTVSGNIVKLKISILFMDLVNKDLTNETEVLSDTLQIALDCRAYLSHPDYDDLFIIADDMQLTPFYEKGDNEVTGWQMDIQANITDLKDRCAIPV